MSVYVICVGEGHWVADTVSVSGWEMSAPCVVDVWSDYSNIMVVFFFGFIGNKKDSQLRFRIEVDGKVRIWMLDFSCLNIRYSRKSCFIVNMILFSFLLHIHFLARH